MITDESEMPSRDSYHTQLATAIRWIDSVELRVKRLISRIEEGDQKTNEESSVEAISHTEDSLCKVLHEGATEINKKVQTIHDLLDQLESDLF